MFVNTSTEHFQQWANVDIFSDVAFYFQTLREFLPSMIEKNSGMVINVASMAGKGGVAYLVDYW